MGSIISASESATTGSQPSSSSSSSSSVVNGNDDDDDLSLLQGRLEGLLKEIQQLSSTSSSSSSSGVEDHNNLKCPKCNANHTHKPATTALALTSRESESAVGTTTIMMPVFLTTLSICSCCSSTTAANSTTSGINSGGGGGSVVILACGHSVCNAFLNNNNNNNKTSTQPGASSDILCPHCPTTKNSQQKQKQQQSPSLSLICSHGARVLLPPPPSLSSTLQDATRTTTNKDNTEQCPICLEEVGLINNPTSASSAAELPPFLIVLPCGHTLCNQDFIKIGGIMGQDANLTLKELGQKRRRRHQQLLEDFNTIIGDMVQQLQQRLVVWTETIMKKKKKDATKDSSTASSTTSSSSSSSEFHHGEDEKEQEQKKKKDTSSTITDRSSSSSEPQGTEEQDEQDEHKIVKDVQTILSLLGWIMSCQYQNRGSKAFVEAGGIKIVMDVMKSFFTEYQYASFEQAQIQQTGASILSGLVCQQHQPPQTRIRNSMTMIQQENLLQHFGAIFAKPKDDDDDDTIKKNQRRYFASIAPVLCKLLSVILVEDSGNQEYLHEHSNKELLKNLLQDLIRLMKDTIQTAKTIAADEPSVQEAAADTVGTVLELIASITGGEEKGPHQIALRNMIIKDCDGAKACVQVMKEYPDLDDLQCNCIGALCHLSFGGNIGGGTTGDTTGAIKIIGIDLGGIELVTKAMRRHPTVPRLQIFGFNFLWSMTQHSSSSSNNDNANEAADDELVLQSFRSNKVLQVIGDTMSNLSEVPKVQLHGVSVLASIAKRFHQEDQQQATTCILLDIVRPLYHDNNDDGASVVSPNSNSGDGGSQKYPEALLHENDRSEMRTIQTDKTNKNDNIPESKFASYLAKKESVPESKPKRQQPKPRKIPKSVSTKAKSFAEVLMQQEDLSSSDSDSDDDDDSQASWKRDGASDWGGDDNKEDEEEEEEEERTTRSRRTTRTDNTGDTNKTWREKLLENQNGNLKKELEETKKKLSDDHKTFREVQTANINSIQTLKQENQDLRLCMSDLTAKVNLLLQTVEKLSGSKQPSLPPQQATMPPLQPTVQQKHHPDHRTPDKSSSKRPKFKTPPDMQPRGMTPPYQPLPHQYIIPAFKPPPGAAPPPPMADKSPALKNTVNQSPKSEQANNSVNV